MRDFVLILWRIFFSCWLMWFVLWRVWKSLGSVFCVMVRIYSGIKIWVGGRVGCMYFKYGGVKVVFGEV